MLQEKPFVPGHAFIIRSQRGSGVFLASTPEEDWCPLLCRLIMSVDALGLA